MYSSRARLVVITCSCALAIGCGTDRALDPRDANVLFSTSGRGGGTAPSGLAATAVSSSRIDLGWLDNSTNETSFEVHRSTSGSSGPFALLVTVGANVTTYSNIGLTAPK